MRGRAPAGSPVVDASGAESHPLQGRRVLVTGGAGLLGATLLQRAPTGVEIHATWRHTPVHAAPAHRLDLSDEARVQELWRTLRPHLVIHTAYSAAHGERDIWQATRNVVAACQESGAALIHLSTDALLDGENAPYAESAEPAPLHEYGRWKAAAERHARSSLPSAAVVRTSLITSPGDPRTMWIRNALAAGEPLTLFVDELRCPIAPDDLARQLWEVAALPDGERGGVWHLAGPEALSRYALGALIAARYGLDPSGITPARSASHPTPRPRDLRLLTTRADRRLSTRARPISEALLSGAFENGG